MKIGCDAQLLLEQKKTGIGKMIDYILENLAEEEKDEIFLNYFRARRENKQVANIQKYKKYSNVKIECCHWLYHFIYRRISKIIPLPYSMFFRKKYDIMLFFNYCIPYGVFGKKAVFVYDVAYKVYPETIQKETFAMLNHNLEKACKRADKIITISEFSKKEIIKYLEIPKEKIAIVPCAVDKTIFHPNYKKEAVENIIEKYGIYDRYILYLGTLEPRKNIVQLIEAYYLLKKRELKHIPKLVIAGKKGWNFENIFQLVEQYDLNDDVIFTGYVNDEEIPYILSGAFCFAFPSLYEGFGMPPLEAMACGVPVISSNVASIPEVVGDAGILVNPKSSEELCEALYVLATNEEMRESLIKKGLERSQMFSWKKSVDILRAVIQEMIEGKNEKAN